MSNARPSILILAAPILALASCHGSPARLWVEVRTEDVSMRDLQEECLFVLNHAGLRADEIDASSGKIVTAWDEHLFPFYTPAGEGGGGYRRRAHIEFVDADLTSEERANRRATGRTIPKVVRVRVEKERNDEKKHPSDPKLAKWEPDNDDVHLADRIAMTLQNQISSFEPSEDFKRRFGGTAAAPGDPKVPGDKDNKIPGVKNP